MSAEYTFYDFLDDSGTNVIHEWLQGQPKGMKQKFNRELLHLEAMPPGTWTRPLVDTLRDGLIEVRAGRGRILAMHTRGRRPILLHCFIKNTEEVPGIECDRALANKNQFDANPAKHGVEHNYE